MGIPKKETVKPNNHPLGLSERELRARHDKTFIIQQAVRKLHKGEYVLDQDMRDKVCRISPQFWRNHAEKSIFDCFKMRIDGKVYWGIPSDIQRLKEELNAA